MKKSQFAQTIQAGRLLEQLHESTLERMTKALTEIFSGIATADPDYALEILDQINDQRAGIEEMRDERAQNNEKMQKMMVNGLSDSIVFEDEDEDDE